MGNHFCGGSSSTWLGLHVVWMLDVLFEPASCLLKSWASVSSLCRWDLQVNFHMKNLSFNGNYTNWLSPIRGAPKRLHVVPGGLNQRDEEVSYEAAGRALRVQINAVAWWRPSGSLWCVKSSHRAATETTQSELTKIRGE